LQQKETRQRAREARDLDRVDVGLMPTDPAAAGEPMPITWVIVLALVSVALFLVLVMSPVAETVPSDEALRPRSTVSAPVD